MIELVLYLISLTCIILNSYVGAGSPFFKFCYFSLSYSLPEARGLLYETMDYQCLSIHFLMGVCTSICNYNSRA